MTRTRQLTPAETRLYFGLYVGLAWVFVVWTGVAASASLAFTRGGGFGPPQEPPRIPPTKPTTKLEPVKPGSPFAHEIAVAAHLCNVAPGFIRAHAIRESSLNPRAVSKSGAVGLMQLKVGAAKDMGLQPRERYDPQKNLIAGACYYRMLLDRFGGDRHRALVAYHRGASGGTSPVSRAYADDVIGSAQ